MRPVHTMQLVTLDLGPQDKLYIEYDKGHYCLVDDYYGVLAIYPSLYDAVVALAHTDSVLGHKATSSAP